MKRIIDLPIPYDGIRPKGKWIEKGDELECSICGDYWLVNGTGTAQAIKKHFRYCAFCGAKMESEDGSNN